MTWLLALNLILNAYCLVCVVIHNRRLEALEAAREFGEGT